MKTTRALTINHLLAMKREGEKIAMLTCYDATFASAMDRAGVDLILVGDSLGMVVQGKVSTVGVRVDEVAYHTACV
jgi:3-methyl-2-oxobutanoate hydroxymethyltransferase